MSRLPGNYRWWQDHGKEWFDEVTRRKASMPIYHLQEIFLEETISRSAPARVLEFGCGFGRHLEYLRKIPKIDLYGYEQSQSMVDAMRWATPSWRKKRIRVGKPLSRLPYEDDSFDLVFTVSVLIHVRPKDLDFILSELYRVSRNQILHIENNETHETTVTSDAHAGCWAHDLESAYQRVAPGIFFETLPRCFEIEDLYRIAKDPTVLPEPMSASRAKRFLKLDQDLGTEIVRLRSEIDHTEQARASLRCESDALRLELERAIDQSERFQLDVESLRSRALTAEERIATLLERATTAEARLDESQTRLQDAKERVTASNEKAARLSTENRELRERARSAEGRLEGLLARATDAERRLAETQESLGQSHLEIDASKVRIEELRINEETLRRRARTAEKKTTDLLERVRTSEETRLAVLERAKKAEDESRALRVRAQSAEGRADSARSRAIEAEKTLRLRSESLHAAGLRIRKLDSTIADLHIELEAARTKISEAESSLRTLREGEEALRSRLEHSRHQIDVERQRADSLNSALMLSQGVVDRLVEQERAAQSLVIALRNRTKQGEQKAEERRIRARSAEEKLALSETARKNAIRDHSLRLAAERERADDALGRIDDVRREHDRIESELRAVRTRLASMLGR